MIAPPATSRSQAASSWAGGSFFTREMSFWLFCSPLAPPTFASTPPPTPNLARIARVRCSRRLRALLRCP
eukprot:802405-Prymnesium_polylepis.1